MSSITRVLVANRGEITRRVFATARDPAGIGTVAVFPIPTPQAPLLCAKDCAVHSPGAAAGRDLSARRPDPRRCERAPTPSTLAMALRRARVSPARSRTPGWSGSVGSGVDRHHGLEGRVPSLMAAAGVPVLDRLDPAGITDADLPVLVKASAGAAAGASSPASAISREP